MALLRNPTTAAALIIAVGLVLMAWIIGRAAKRLGRGLSEGARAFNAFTASLNEHNRIAEQVNGLRQTQVRHNELLTRIDGLLRRWHAWFPTIQYLDGYLTAMDGRRYTEWQNDPDAEPPAERPPDDSVYEQGSAMGPNPQYPELPFDPDNPGSIERYLLRIVHEADPRADLDGQLTGEQAAAFGPGHTWRRWAHMQTNRRYGAVLHQYGLAPLGTDATQTFARIEDDRPTD
jgi:hypothetical protein